ncbi:hypothetical protein HK104_006212 [Borealophlyctis nickersoniae]|nr:hypothetical protein HK104_006212 [Borealophlyctis nickersoniae]
MTVSPGGQSRQHGVLPTSLLLLLLALVNFPSHAWAQLSPSSPLIPTRLSIQSIALQGSTLLTVNGSSLITQYDLKSTTSTQTGRPAFPILFSPSDAPSFYSVVSDASTDNLYLADVRFSRVYVVTPSTRKMSLLFDPALLRGRQLNGVLSQSPLTGTIAFSTVNSAVYLTDRQGSSLTNVGAFAGFNILDLAVCGRKSDGSPRGVVLVLRDTLGMVRVGGYELDSSGGFADKGMRLFVVARTGSMAVSCVGDSVFVAGQDKVREFNWESADGFLGTLFPANAKASRPIQVTNPSGLLAGGSTGSHVVVGSCAQAGARTCINVAYGADQRPPGTPRPPTPTTPESSPAPPTANPRSAPLFPFLNPFKWFFHS